MRVRPRKSARHSKTQYLIAALVPALIILFSITGFVWASTEITIVEDGRTRHIETQAADVEGALAEAGVDLSEADVVTPPRDAGVQGGMTILVRHAVPVKLDLGGEVLDVDVVGESVADALVAAGIDPSSNPAVVPPLGTSIESGMTIRVPDVFVRVVQEETTVAPAIRRERDASLVKGTTRVITKGAPGRVLRVYRVIVSGGVESTRVLTAERVVAKPVARIVAVGTSSARTVRFSTREVPPAPKSGRRMRVVATGYSAQQPDLNDTTATGAKARHGVIAVDPRTIPLGTRVYIPGYGYAVAADTGGAIKGNRIDLCFDTVAEAFAWGRRSVTIIVLD